MNSTTAPVHLPSPTVPVRRKRTADPMALAKSETLGNVLREVRHQKQQAIEREAAERLRAFLAAMADRD